MNLSSFGSAFGKELAIAGFVSMGLLLVPALARAESTSMPTQSIEATSVAGNYLAQAATGSIVDVAADDPRFDTLVQAIMAANLTDTLAGEGPYTVFAPTNEAFAALPEDALEALLQPENRDLLTEILLYHVVPGEVTAEELETGGLDTLNGGLAVQVTDDQVIVNDASVVQANIQADNGVIHAINQVLIPATVRPELEALLQQPAQPTAQPAQPTEPDQPVRALW